MKAEFVAKDLPRLELDTVWPWARREGCRAGRHLTRFVAGTCVLEAMMRCGGGKVEGHEGMAGLLPMPSAQLTSPDIFRPADLEPSRSCARQPQSRVSKRLPPVAKKHGCATARPKPSPIQSVGRIPPHGCCADTQAPLTLPSPSKSPHFTLLPPGPANKPGISHPQTGPVHLAIHVQSITQYTYTCPCSQSNPLIFRTTVTQHGKQGTAS